MKTRREIDAEIAQGRRAAIEIERGIGRRSRIDAKYDKEVAREEAEKNNDGHWHWLTVNERHERAEGIMEKFEMGWPHKDIAAFYDLTVQRISQIVNSFGAGWR